MAERVEATTDKDEENRSDIQGLETLTVPQSTDGGVGVKSAAEGIGDAQFQEQIGIRDQQVLASALYPHSQDQTQNVQQLISCPTSLSELSPTSVTQSPSPVLLDQRPPLQRVNGLCTLEEDKQLSSDFKCMSPVPFVKTSASDGYNWRKYGQKQVKSPPGSRSYYRCTFSECFVKKVESCDISGHLIEIVYKSQHTHDPPQRSNCTREVKVASSAVFVGNNAVEYPCRITNDSELSTTLKEHIQENPVPERKRPSSSDSDGNGDAMMNEVHINDPEAKKRLKKSNSECSDSLLISGKKPKFVVHAAGDVGVSGDGYRWRKYGQKMVKGNPHPRNYYSCTSAGCPVRKHIETAVDNTSGPHPRNYYRCTSAGCPVRKHIETAVDNTSGIIITYKGIHDHDMPVPKKRHGPPNALVVASAPASMNTVQTDTGEQQSSTQCSVDKGSHQALTQWSVDKGGELTGETLELGGEKAMESARTLLSIGFEIKPC